MKIDFIADTNFLIYIHEGNKMIEPFLEYNFGISFISGFKGISKSEEMKLKNLIADCYLIDWNSIIKEKTIELRKNYNIKLPDAVVAATSLSNNTPLVTADRGFSKITELDLILIEF